jgi:tight adherence protein C
MEMVKLVGLVATFVGITVALYYVLKLRAERATFRVGLEQSLYSADIQLQTRSGPRGVPFAQRVLRPGSRRLAVLVYRFGPKGIEENNKKRLQLAGLADKLDPDTFFSLSMLAPIVALGALWMYGKAMGDIPGLFWMFVPGAAMWPKMWLTRKVEERKHQILLALADTLDLMTIAVEAGLGFDAAMSRVVNAIPGPLSDELHRMLQELRIGVPRHEALKNLSERTDVEALDQFITAVNQADAFGIAIGKVLRVQAQQLRLKRRQIAQEKAAKTPIKILGPLMLCIFPALFTVLVGPAAISIMKNMSGY